MSSLLMKLAHIRCITRGILSDETAKLNLISYKTHCTMGDSNDDVNETLVQYVLIRTDLKSSLKWPYGAIMAQACHASIAAIHSFYSHDDTKSYLKDLERMHKIILQVPDEKSLQEINDTLKKNDVDFYQWLEKPDDIYTSLALRPYPKSKVESYFKGLKLFRN